MKRSCEDLGLCQARTPACLGCQHATTVYPLELLGSDTNFAAVQSTAPSGRAEGIANLGSDPKNSLQPTQNVRKQLLKT